MLRRRSGNPVEPLKPATQPLLYTEDDLHIRQFTDSTTRRLTRKECTGRHSRVRSH